MKNKEEIYLNLALCSEEERKELSKILNYKIGEVREFPLLVFEGGNLDQYETGFYKLKNKTEVNFQEFKEIMGEVEDAQNYYDLANRFIQMLFDEGFNFNSEQQIKLTDLYINHRISED